MVERALEIDSETFDLCVVGGGPVGLAVALEAAERGLGVVLVEAGPADGTASPANTVEIADPARHAPMSIAAASGLGGTSKIWGGRCVAFDPVDFAARTYVRETAWPFSQEIVERYYPAAARLLGCGAPDFVEDREAWPNFFETLSTKSVERWTPLIDAAKVNRERIAAARTLVLRERHRVVDLRFDGVRLDAVEVSTASRRYGSRARAFVLASGGIGTTRILLGHQRLRPLAFGGADGPLGRYYMGHISGKIASVIFDRPAEAGHLDFFRAPDHTYIRRRITLREDTQIRERLLNAAFWLDNPPFYDAEHRNAILSSVFLALAMPPVGRRIVPEAVRLAHIGAAPRAYGRHVLNLVKSPHLAARGIAEIIRDRYLSDGPKPGFLIRNRGGRYALHYHAEQLPIAESRIRLKAHEAGDGLPLVSVDLRYCRTDANSVVRSHAIIDAALRHGGIGRLDYWHPAAEREDRILDQASDGIHQVGTTRMSTDPKNGVVDENLRVHGTPNLFVASSSVFPTTGQANPTFLAVALGIRLAHRLAGELTVKRSS
jgi:choline dehydrogenase-like flavoprotein